MDILVSLEDKEVGFLAETVDEFADSIFKSLIGFDNDPKIVSMRSAAYDSLQRFSDNRDFAKTCSAALELDK